MHEHIDFPGRSAVKVKYREMPYFTYPWHFHNEYELLYVIDGFGTSYVADSIKPFQSGDLALLGGNLPHFWKSDESYYKEDNQKNVKYIVIQFPNDFFQDLISKYPEFRLIGDLFERASQGIRFLPGFVSSVSKRIIKISKTSGVDRVVLLLQLLQELANTEEYILLAGEIYHAGNLEMGSDRLTKVLHYINTKYQHKIVLEEVAEMAHMHPSAFCRFFKEKTGKSLLEYVNDMRISYACKLIIENRRSISQICFESGFNNLSNFNRTFKRQTGFTPTSYYEEFQRH
jgi:AraC-like DNA-binding protein